MKSTPVLRLPLGRVTCFLAHQLTKWNDFYIVVIWTVRQLPFSQLSSAHRRGGGAVAFLPLSLQQWIPLPLLQSVLHSECIELSMSFLSRSQISPHSSRYRTIILLLHHFFLIIFKLKSDPPYLIRSSFVCLFVCSCMHQCVCNRLHFRSTHTHAHTLIHSIHFIAYWKM